MKRPLFGIAIAVLFALALFGCDRGGSRDVPKVDQPTALAATTTGRAIPHGVSHGTLEFAGLERSYRLFVPSGVSDPGQAPLVVALHGGLGSGDQFATASNFETLAETEGFIVVFPDGADRTWNAGTCCGQAVSKDTDDVGFLAALIDQLKADLPVDPASVFMTGHSNGAMMAFRFGCERAEW